MRARRPALRTCVRVRASFYPCHCLRCTLHPQAMEERVLASHMLPELQAQLSTANTKEEAAQVRPGQLAHWGAVDCTACCSRVLC